MVSDRSPDQAAVDLELLRLLAKQGRRVPYPVSISALALMMMSWGRVPHWISVAWLMCAYGVLALRRWLLVRLPEMHHRRVDQRVRWAVGLSLLNGLVFSAAMVMWPWLSEYQRMVQTILVMGLCAGAVATTAGYGPVFLSFLVPVAVSNALAWMLTSDSSQLPWMDLLLGGLILAFAAILAGLARDTYRVFAESVQIRMQQLRSNQQLRLALTRAEQAMQAKTRFLASASHDLRQPMHTLTLFGAALSKRPLPEDSACIVAQMNRALQSLSSQMDALLDISKLDAQVVPVNNQVFALAPWLGRLVQELRPAAERKRLSLRLDCPEQACIETDPVLLDRVLRNLIDNAIKYTTEGEVAVEVSGGGDLWRLAVRDTGPGIPEQEQARIFEEFYQLGNPERDRSKGLGLGLSIVSRLVDLMELHLALRSAPGQGSSFSLSIPAAEFAHAARSGDAPTGPALPPLRVLVVDEEEPVRLAMRSLLESHGCEVLCAGTIREGLLQCLGARPDLALVDYRLGSGYDGIAAVRSLRTAMPGLPALLISGDTAPERLREAHEAGLTLLHKPLTEEQLIGAIQAALADRRREHRGGADLNQGTVSAL